MVKDVSKDIKEEYQLMNSFKYIHQGTIQSPVEDSKFIRDVLLLLQYLQVLHNRWLHAEWFIPQVPQNQFQKLFVWIIIKFYVFYSKTAGLENLAVMTHLMIKCSLNLQLWPNSDVMFKYSLHAENGNILNLW